MTTRILKTLLLFAVLFGEIFAQNQGDLDRLDAKFSHYFENIMPGWKHERVEPFSAPGTTSENVLIEFWSSSNRKVKVSILLYKSGDEARQVFQSSAKYHQEKQELKGFGDEAYAWGYGLSDVAFRRGRFTIFVSTTAEVDSDPDARTLSQSERFEREKSERQRLTMEFAKHMVNAIDAP